MFSVASASRPDGGGSNSVVEEDDVVASSVADPDDPVADISIAPVDSLLTELLLRAVVKVEVGC